MIWGCRATRFEEKVAKLNSNRLITICWEEKSREDLREIYSEERKIYYNDVWLNYGYVKEKLIQGKEIVGEEYKIKWDIEKQIINTKMNESRYNKHYKKIASDTLPEYLINKNGSKNISVLARVRCVNFANENKYWLKENERLCKLCGKDWGSFNHYFEECEKTVESTENLPGEKYSRFSELMLGTGNRDIVKAITVIEKEIQNKIEKEKDVVHSEVK